MAIHIINFSKLGASFRLVRYFTDKGIKFSTSQDIINKKDAPVKYSINKAAHIPISQVIGLDHKKSSRLWYEKYVIVGSIFTFLVYFCVIRKENDIDEALKGNPEFIDPRLKLLQLKIQLKYCEANKLPTGELRTKIEELEEIYNKYKSPFRK